jgi:hypothetical protein
MTYEITIAYDTKNFIKAQNKATRLTKKGFTIVDHQKINKAVKSGYFKLKKDDKL